MTGASSLTQLPATQLQIGESEPVARGHRPTTMHLGDGDSPFTERVVVTVEAEQQRLCQTAVDEAVRRQADKVQASAFRKKGDATVEGDDVPRLLVEGFRQIRRQGRAADNRSR